MSIEGISLENFSASTHTKIETTPQAGTHHVVLHYFFSDYRKHYATTTISHRKRIIKLFK